MSPKLTPNELAILEHLGQDGGSWQVNTWAIQGERINSFWVRSDLNSLKRRGLVDAEGRGQYRQWWITEKGKLAIAEAAP